MSSSIALVVRRTIRAPAERVFAAWTDPTLLTQWWGPAHVTCCDATVDLRVGGQYRIGNQLGDGSVVWIFGEFEAIVPNARLVYSWNVEGKVPESGEASRVTVRFEPRDPGTTEVIVVHERIDTEETRADHERGWLGCLDGLEALASKLSARSGTT